MSSPQRSPSTEAAESNARKRVCKACDRCRLKKSKCDGASPCSRCKTDNAICVFGERKKSHDKVYPKGYVEMLEQQQSQLVAGLRELYRRVQSGEGWPGQELLDGPGGHPLTHDILERLDLLHMKGESGQHYSGFEEDTAAMQKRLVEGGAPCVQRRGSISSNSEHGHHSTASSYNSPAPQQLTFKDPFSRNVAPPTPPMTDSSFLGQAQPNSPVRLTPQFTMPQMLQTGYNSATLMQTSSANPTSMMDDNMLMDQLESPMSFDGSTMFGQYSAVPAPASNNFTMTDWNETNDLDFNNFISTNV